MLGGEPFVYFMASFFSEDDNNENVPTINNFQKEIHPFSQMETLSMQAEYKQLFGSKHFIPVPGTLFCALESSPQFKT